MSFGKGCHNEQRHTIWLGAHACRINMIRGITCTCIRSLGTQYDVLHIHIYHGHGLPKIWQTRVQLSPFVQYTTSIYVPSRTWYSMPLQDWVIIWNTAWLGGSTSPKISSGLFEYKDHIYAMRMPGIKERWPRAHLFYDPHLYRSFNQPVFMIAFALNRNHTISIENITITLMCCWYQTHGYI